MTFGSWTATVGGAGRPEPEAAARARLRGRSAAERRAPRRRAGRGRRRRRARPSSPASASMAPMAAPRPGRAVAVDLRGSGSSTSTAFPSISSAGIRARAVASESTFTSDDGRGGRSCPPGEADRVLARRGRSRPRSGIRGGSSTGPARRPASRRSGNSRRRRSASSPARRNWAAMYSAARSSPREGVSRPSSRSEARNERCPASESAEIRSSAALRSAGRSLGRRGEAWPGSGGPRGRGLGRRWVVGIGRGPPGVGSAGAMPHDIAAGTGPKCRRGRRRRVRGAPQLLRLQQLAEGLPRRGHVEIGLPLLAVRRVLDLVNVLVPPVVALEALARRLQAKLVHQRASGMSRTTYAVSKPLPSRPSVMAANRPFAIAMCCFGLVAQLEMDERGELVPLKVQRLLAEHGVHRVAHLAIVLALIASRPPSCRRDRWSRGCTPSSRVGRAELGVIALRRSPSSPRRGVAQSRIGGIVAAAGRDAEAMVRGSRSGS